VFYDAPMAVDLSVHREFMKLQRTESRWVVKVK